MAAAGGLEGTAIVFVGLVAHEGDFGGGEVGVGGGKEEEKKGGDGGGGFGRMWGEETEGVLTEFVEADAGEDGEGEGFEEEVPGDPFGMDEPAEAGGADGTGGDDGEPEGGLPAAVAAEGKGTEGEEGGEAGEFEGGADGVGGEGGGESDFGGVERFFGVPGHAGEDGAEGIVQPVGAHGSTGELDEVIFGVFDLEEAGIDEVDEEAGGEEVGDEPAGDGGGAISGRGDF